MTPRPLHRVLALLALLTATALALPAARAHGILVPTDRTLPPLGLQSHRVEIAVNDGIALVTIDQVWKNSTDRPLEATYFFPVPRGAVVSGFELEVNGKMQKGEMLEREKAARIYQDIVNRLRDPGLVEWMDKDLFQVRIFPVPARGTQKLRLKYVQAAEVIGGNFRIVYPLRTSNQSLQTLEDFTLTAKLRGAIPVRTVYSPSHRVSITNRDGTTTVGFEDDRVLLDKDFVLYFGMSNEDVGITTLTHKKGSDSGFFLLTAAPRASLESKEIQGKAITFVLDTSGSMTGEKMEQARAALKYCIERLGSDDRFDIVRFASDVERFSSSGMVAASDSNKKRALEFVDGFEAAGGTAIDEALTAALARAEAGSLVLFVTDGRPTVGEVDTTAILKQAEKRNVNKARLFVMGVGEDLNTHLMDLLGSTHGGTSHYVRPGEDVKVAISALYEQIAFPILSDVQLTIDGVKVYAQLPQRIPDLFRGQQLIVTGRYRGAGKAKVRLEGRLGKETRRFEVTVDFPEEQKEQDFIATVWAHRQVGYLLDQIRLNGETRELREEVIQLAKQYGIVTPYTSWLVVDDSELTAPPRPRPPEPRPPWPHPPWGPRPIRPPWQEGDAGGGASPTTTTPQASPRDLERKADERERIVRDTAAAGQGRAEAFRDDRGKAGLDAAEAVKILKEKSDDAPEVQAVKRIGGRVFRWSGTEGWVDQAADASQKRVRITAFSAEWTALASRGADVRQALALGDRIQIRIGDTVYVITP
ncbi:MAG: VWA domain-containing protein [Deltaproteobacteria bacterium]|nr:VWA domain-containing protein [Deltaproteobacteria bacterium]